MCFQVVCLEIIRSHPQEVLHVFPIREFSTKLAEDFVFLSVKPQPFVFTSMPPGTCVFFFFFLVKAGVSDAVVISLSSDDGFPPKKEYSEPCTYFRFDILWLTF